MIEIAFRCRPSEGSAGPKVMRVVQEGVDRGWQDKSRKVRPVGWLGNVSNFSHAPNLAKNCYTFPILPGRCSSSVFDTLWRAR